MAAQPTPAHPSTMAATLHQNPISAFSPLPTPILRTPRLIIRPLHPQDAESMQQHAAPTSIQKYMSLAFPSPYTLEASRNWISINLAAPINAFAICLVEAPEIVIGGIGLKPGADVMAHSAEVGYWIGEPYWGQGLSTEALAAFTEWCFTQREGRLTRLWGGVFSGNWGSKKCLERCGYKAEGVMKGHIEKHGVVMDLHVLGLTRGDWDEWKRAKEEEQ